jgi:hypothetical protein
VSAPLDDVDAPPVAGALARHDRAARARSDDHDIDLGVERRILLAPAEDLEASVGGHFRSLR